MTEPMGLRERKKAETRSRIEAAAIDLIERDGFDATTIETIAAAADISTRTFFYYFPTKEDVVLANYADRLASIIDQLNQRPRAEPPWAALRASFVLVAADYDSEQSEITRRFRTMAATPSVYARSLQLQAGWEDELALALVERMDCLIEDLGPRLLASCALSAIRSSLQHWIETGQESSLPPLVQGCFDMLEDGLADVT